MNIIPIKSLIATIICIFAYLHSYSQKPSIKFATPAQDNITINTSQYVFSGLAQPLGKLWINKKSITIYNTGAFATQIDSLPIGIDTIEVIYIYHEDTLRKTFFINREIKVNKPLEGFQIAAVSIYPENTQWVKPGDVLQISVEATPGMQVTCFNKPLLEQDSSIVGKTGIYKGSYIFAEKDTEKLIPVEATLYDPIHKTKTFKSEGHTIKVLTNQTITGYSIGQLPYMVYGYGDDRLGGAKMGYIDSLIPFIITGKVNDHYRVQLAQNHTAYIPTNQIVTTNSPTLSPTILSGNWRVYPIKGGDQVKIDLEEKRPYSSITEVSPSRIMIDIYGVASNTNWITKLQGLKVIKNIWYEQINDDILRVFIDLKKSQVWGYDIHYEGNSLMIFVKNAPASSEWKDLTIAIDAGHGGSNLGADGLTGALEKDITLAVALKMEKQLKLLGAKVIMTRTNDTSFNMGDRILYLKKLHPDLLVSFHCNSAGPLTQGNSTYYRYIGFAPLSEYIHKEMLQLGLEDYGNIGSFNFALSGPTQYINALNEMAFISNPEDESKLLNPIWQNKIVKATIEGISNFLQAAIKPN